VVATRKQVSPLLTEKKRKNKKKTGEGPGCRARIENCHRKMSDAVREAYKLS